MIKVTLVFFWLIQIPLSYYLAIEPDGQHSEVFWAVFCYGALVGLYALYLFKQGRWKRVKL